MARSACGRSRARAGESERGGGQKDSLIGIVLLLSPLKVPLSPFDCEVSNRQVASKFQLLLLRS